MNPMELKSSTTTFFLLFLLLATPYISRGRSDLNSEIYEIDYRGPETHSYIPPPRSGGKPHQESVMATPRSKGLGARHVGKNGKNTRG